MRIFVINLVTRTDRRDAVTRKLAGTQFDFFCAVAANDVPERHFTSVDNLHWLMETGHGPESTELGCYASHLELWKKCIELQQPIVIMEDDFNLSRHFERALEYAEQRIDACGFIRLEALESRWVEKSGLEPAVLEESGGMRLLFQRMPSVRLTCYALSPMCAEALVAASSNASQPVDHYVRRCWAHRQAILAIEPAAITLSDHAQDSSIGGRKKSPLRHLLAPFRALYRSRERQQAKDFAARKLPEIVARLAASRPAGTAIRSSASAAPTSYAADESASDESRTG
jgi:glycosyl transferase family 25